MATGKLKSTIEAGIKAAEERQAELQTEMDACQIIKDALQAALDIGEPSNPDTSNKAKSNIADKW